MSRLLAQWQRLYLMPAAPEGLSPGAPAALPGRAGGTEDAGCRGDGSGGDGSGAGRIWQDGQGRVRTLSLSLAGPADWSPLSVLWQAVQSELAWPAPGIAVSGDGAYALWFSLAEPVSRSEASQMLRTLQRCHLPEVAAERLAAWPALDETRWPSLPGQEVRPGQWSAFVAPDLAPVFAGSPWLDISPGEDGQADLLAGLRSIPAAAWRAAVARLGVSAERPFGVAAPHRQPVPEQPPTPADQRPTPRPTDARAFLSAVMTDPDVPLALRIEAAKALLCTPPCP